MRKVSHTVASEISFKGMPIKVGTSLDAIGIAPESSLAYLSSVRGFNASERIGDMLRNSVADGRSYVEKRGCRGIIESRQPAWRARILNFQIG